jgi:hypothetical protein
MKIMPQVSIYLKGDCFVPESIAIYQGTIVEFKNEGWMRVNLQCKGNINFPNFTLDKFGSSSVSFPSIGKYEITLASNTSIKVN